jgi:hypothetical protein
LREIEQRLGLASRLVAHMADPREPTQVVHPLEDIVRFRMLMIAAGYDPSLRSIDTRRELTRHSRGLG